MSCSYALGVLGGIGGTLASGSTSRLGKFGNLIAFNFAPGLIDFNQSGGAFSFLRAKTCGVGGGSAPFTLTSGPSGFCISGSIRRLPEYTDRVLLMRGRGGGRGGNVAGLSGRAGR